MGEKLDVSWAPESLCRAYFSSGHVGASGDVLFTDVLSGLRDSPARWVRLDDVVIVGAAQTETHVGVAETVTIHAFFEAGRDLLLAACIEPHFVQHPLGSESPLSTAAEAIARRGWELERLQSVPTRTVEQVMGAAFAFGITPSHVEQIVARPRSVRTRYPARIEKGEVLPRRSGAEARWLVQAEGGYFRNAASYTTRKLALLQEVEPWEGQATNY
jgi:hypothetical protein